MADGTRSALDGSKIMYFLATVVFVVIDRHCYCEVKQATLHSTELQSGPDRFTHPGPALVAIRRRRPEVEIATIARAGVCTQRRSQVRIMQRQLNIMTVALCRIRLHV